MEMRPIVGLRIATYADEDDVLDLRHAWKVIGGSK
jgi:hypothetical protein